MAGSIGELTVFRPNFLKFVHIFVLFTDRKWPEVPTDIKIQPSSSRAFHRGV